MKKRDINKSFISKNSQELIKELDSSYFKLNRLIFDRKFRKLKDYSQISKMKKNIARIWTFLKIKSVK